MVFFLEFLVVIALLWIQIVETSFILVIDFLDLLLVLLDFGFTVALLAKQNVKMCALLVILVLDMHIESLNVLWLCVASVLVECQIVVCQLSFVFTDVFDE